MKPLALCASILALLVLLPACAPTEPPVKPGSNISVNNAWVRPALSPGSPGAAYMQIQNTGAASDTLTSAATDVAASVELHESMQVNGMMQMKPMPNMPVPAQGTLELAPGGKHMMLMGLKRELKPGDVITLTLTFQNTPPLQVPATVKAP